MSNGDIEGYMSDHRRNNNIDELKTHFVSEIDWTSTVFKDVEKEMCRLEWGKLYKTYHKKSYNPDNISNRVHELYAGPYAKNGKGIFEYILVDCHDTRLLDIRAFDDVTKRRSCKKQTKNAEEKGISNCSLRAICHEANNKRIYHLNKMDADHVSAWSKSGLTPEDNLQMLCRAHNHIKGNR